MFSGGEVVPVTVKMRFFERLIACPATADCAWLANEVEKRFKAELGYAIEVESFQFSDNRLILQPADKIKHACAKMSPQRDHLVVNVKSKVFFVTTTSSDPEFVSGETFRWQLTFDDTVQTVFDGIARKINSSDWKVDFLSFAPYEPSILPQKRPSAMQMNQMAFPVHQIALEREKFAKSTKSTKSAKIEQIDSVPLLAVLVRTPEHMRIMACFRIEEVVMHGQSVRYFVFTDCKFIGNLREEMPDESELFQKEPRLLVMRMLRLLKVFESSDHEKLRRFAEYLKKENEALLQPIIDALKVDKIAFQALWYRFAKGSQMKALLHRCGETEQFVAFTATAADYVVSGLSEKFVVNGILYEHNGTGFYKRTHAFSIEPYDGLKTLDALPIRLLSNEDAQVLAERGRKFVQLAIAGSQHVAYNGLMLMHSSNGYVHEIDATGRVMLDTILYQQYSSAPQFKRNPSSYLPGAVPEGELMSCLPLLGAWSFGLKRWGQVFINNIAPIVYDTAAFDRIVLPKDQKEVIAAMVENFDKIEESGDVVAGKGAGMVFLFHGPPGVGKTVTAESIAEMCRRPLYIVTAGELGTNAASLDQALERIIGMTSRWHALVLIDEADVLMAKRDDTDLERNAVISVFLRRIEYQETIMFLTTNRVESLDPAFASRISVAVHYQQFSAETRRLVWASLLRAAGAHKAIENDSDDGSDGGLREKIWALDLNGREIRNAIRVAQTLAKRDNAQVSFEHLHKATSVTTALVFGRTK
jgi:hypothetical protein